jgi:Cu2+-exporting ATPase
MVHEAICGAGLERYYDLRDEPAPAPAIPTGKGYAFLDEDAFHVADVRAAAGGAKSVELLLEGAHCAACVWLVERLPMIVPGVALARLDVRRRVVRVVWDANRVALSRIARALDRLGYPVHPYRASAADAMRRNETRRHLVGIGVAGACAGNAMLAAFALYGAGAAMAADHRMLLRVTGLALTLVALAWPGRVFFRGAISSIRTRLMHMDVPVAIALAAGTIWGAANTIRGTGEVYFESITAVVFLLLVGRFVQDRQHRAAHEAIGLLAALTPSIARRLAPAGGARDVEEVPVEALRPGDLVELRAGDSVPADGRIVAGESRFDLALLTGESCPVARGLEDVLHAGTVNIARRVEMEVQATGAATRAGRLMQLVERCAAERAPVVRLADRVAHGFVVVVIALATITTILWWGRSPEVAVERAIALQIVTCPCALGLATPLALMAAIGRAARRGILIKGGAALESLARPGLLILDKTGTITRGEIAMTSFDGDERAIDALAALEIDVAHPIAAAAIRAARERGGNPAPADGVMHVPGRGVSGVVGGRPVVAGAPPFVAAHVQSVPAWTREAEARCAARGDSPVFVAIGGEIAGVAGFGDAVHPGAREAIARLRALGCAPAILSGDHPAIVERVALEVGIEPAHVRGGVPPEAKADAVRSARDGATVVMVGDGVNDAAALAAATVGVAVHGGAEASLAAADVFMREPGLAPLVELVEGARRAMRAIRRGVAASLGYNAIAAALAMTGVVNPVIAAIMMPISSLTVVTLAFRARTFPER